jgi:hypothetical protein
VNRPFVRDLCGRCAGQVARAYYRNGGAPIEARRR